MALRNIIKIDEGKCDGCGMCATACAEGAIAIIDGKARLVSETYCDGLGACLGECPQGAITMVQAEAAAFDEAAVAAYLAAQGKGHAPSDPEPKPRVPLVMPQAASHSGCPGSRAMSFAVPSDQAASDAGSRPSQLGQWPVQLHLLSPVAPYLAGADLLLAAD
ncbi:MAG TPA: 4Fe-4S binding protein, partial [Thermoanaerobaculaceae bacterium]|nr:4Fe-4S binding protein [Thermoanaerobaculaceae bacterium]